MDFWENVENELIFQGKTKKELSMLTGIKLQSLHKSFERKSEVSAENAVKIASKLNTTVEYLVTGKDSKKDNELLRKYKTTIQALEEIPAAPRKNIEQMILDLSKSINVII